ncbi:MAG: type 3 dihydrofolate reductase [Gammaproteobacteria bacterium]
MSVIALVAAVAENGVIGRGGEMPWHLPADLAHFKRITMGKPIVMGRRTFEAIGRALPGRRNIVVSRNADFKASGVERAANLEAALALADDAEEVMVIGGGELYRAALPFAQRIHLTRIQAKIEGDTFFPEFDASEWHETAREERTADEKNAYTLTFLTLERKQASPD